MKMFTRAIVRKPAETFANGITTANLGKPDINLALKQHEAYCEALIKCGLELTVLDPNPKFPDSCFVEDTAVVTRDFGVIARPGDPRRLGEEVEIQKVLEPMLTLCYIEEPGKLDGGDIMQADNRFFIGLSNRTNLAGSKQLKNIVSKYNYEAYSIPVCNLLHFKTGVNYLGDNNLLIHKDFCSKDDFKSYNQIVIEDDEEYAANSLRVNDYVLVPKGFPKTKASIENLGYQVIEVDLSEYQKMDGGLSCLSLRF
ncbi:MAG: N(G),N(G)-dimethylarginine dimethylaminohydrolase [Marinilabiliales bacterium]|nr:MAG: N(G),N(G)-dimethylarginine dimethylaminohydrolase [Marinilabiliales bacterium]